MAASLRSFQPLLFNVSIDCWILLSCCMTQQPRQYLPVVTPATLQLTFSNTQTATGQPWLGSPTGLHYLLETQGVWQHTTHCCAQTEITLLLEHALFAVSAASMTQMVVRV